MVGWRPSRFLVLILSTVLVSGLWGGDVKAATPSIASPAGADRAGLVDIGGGRSLYLECRGSGGPTVVFEAGYRSPATVWTEDLMQPDAPRTMVLPGVAATTRVCAYERPGVAAVLAEGLITSRSDAVPMPRTAEDVVADLHALLAASGEPGPYVLVGHSLGGLFVRLYAATYPDEVVGLVLVDAYSEWVEAEMELGAYAAYTAFASVVPEDLADYADLETVDFMAATVTMRTAAAAQPLGDLPLFVVSKGQPFGLEGDLPGFTEAELEAASTASQVDLAMLRPDAQHVVARESSHYVQLQQPELVIDAVRQVVAAVRDPATWGS